MMVDQKLIDYINDCKSKNIFDEEIIKNLEEIGWSDADIQQAFSSIKDRLITSSNISSVISTSGNSTTSNKISRPLNILPFVLGLIVLIVIAAGVFFYYNFLREKKSSGLINLTTITPTPLVENNNFQDLANKLFIAAKQKNADSAYELFSLPLQKQIGKDKTLNLFSQLDLSEATSQAQYTLEDTTIYIESSQYQGKKYSGVVSYKSPPNGSLEIGFIKESNQWKIESFYFKRQMIANSGNLDTDLSQIKTKENLIFSLYKPTYLPASFSYDGTTILESTNQNTPDGKLHPFVSLSFSEKANNASSGGTKQILMTQLNALTDEQNLLALVKNQLSIKQSAEKVQLQGGVGIYVSGGQIPLNSLSFIKEDSIITLLSDSNVTKADLVKIANSLQKIP